MRRTLVATAVAAFLLAAGAPPAAADTASDVAAAKAQQALLDQVRTQLGSNLADALAAQQQIVRSLQDNAAQQAATRERMDAAGARLAELDAQIATLDAQAAQSAADAAQERAQLAALARAIYVQPGSVAVELAQAQSLTDLVTRVSDLASAAERARSLQAALDRSAQRLRDARDRQQVARDQEAVIRDRLDADLAKLRDLQAQQESSKSKLQQKIDQTRTELAAVNSQSASVAQQVADLLQQQQNAIIAAAMQQVWDQVHVIESQQPNASITTSAGHSRQYRFIWPEPRAQNVQGFGPSSLVFEPPYNGYPHFHTGIDLVEPAGSPVLAVDDGIVVLVGSGPSGYGNYVVLLHAGGLTTLYGHLLAASVKAGDQVSQGQAVGLEGSTGNSTGPHLHFELRIGDKPVDPLPYLPPGPSDFKG